MLEARTVSLQEYLKMVPSGLRSRKLRLAVGTTETGIARIVLERSAVSSKDETAHQHPLYTYISGANVYWDYERQIFVYEIAASKMDDTNAQQLTDADQAVQYHEQCHRWKLQLDAANSFSEVATVCQDICYHAGRTADRNRKCELVIDTNVQMPDPSSIVGPHLPSNILTWTLLAYLTDTNKTHSQRKIISKSYYNLCYRNMLDGVPLNTVHGMKDLENLEDNSITIYGVLNSRFLNLIQNEPPIIILAVRNLEVFLSPGYNRWFNTATENVLTVERLGLVRNVHNSEMCRRMWYVALMNLQSPYHGVRENMLALLKYVFRDVSVVHKTVLPTMRRWSWLNRNKYHLLGMLLGQYGLTKLLTLLDLDMKMLGEALKLSLKYKHLYSGGQTLIRLLHKEQFSSFVYELVATVIVEEKIELVQVMAKYWFNSFTPKDYRTVCQTHLNLEQVITNYFEPTVGEHVLPAYCVSNKYEKLFLLAYLFRQELQKHVYLQPFLSYLCELLETTKAMPGTTIASLIESLGYYIVACGATGKINTHQHTAKLTHYMLRVMETPGHLAVCNTIVTVCQKLLKHIVLTQQRPSPGKEFDRDAQALVAKFMSYDMYDQFLFPTGTKPLSYQPTITALRLFAAFVEQVLEFTPSSQYVLQMRPAPSIEWIAKLLPETLPLEELGASFRSMVYGLQHLLRSDYDDVRMHALKMLYNRTVAYHFDPKLQDQLAIVFSRDDTEALRHAVHQLLDDTIGKIKVAVQHHQQDFYAAVLMEADHPNGQLHRLIDRCTEICFGYSPDETILSNTELIRAQDCVLEAWNFAHSALTCARGEDEQSGYETSFELMDRCLQQLLEQSDEWKTNYATSSSSIDYAMIGLAKRRIQGALWKAIRAVSIFIENAAIWLVEHNRQVENSQAYEMFHNYLHTLNTIMTTCCHRGASEAVGNCLSHVVRHLMQLKQHVLSSETALAQKDSERFRPLKRYMSVMQQMCRTWLAYPRTHLEDFRRHRGYLWMVHSYMRHDTADITHESLLRMYLDEYTQLGNRAAEHEGKLSARASEEPMPPVPCGPVLWLHQLNLLARETSLNETILPRIDELMIVALAHILSPEWPVRNAALQLYSSCTTKLTGQRQLYNDPDSEWPPTYASSEEVMCKVNRTMRYMWEKVYPVLTKQHNQDDPITSFLLLVLEFLSKLEYRGYYRYGSEPSFPKPYSSGCDAKMTYDYRTIAWTLLHHHHDQVRKLAARCYAQLHDFHTEIPTMLDRAIYKLFTVKDANFRLGKCQAIMAFVQKHVTLGRYVRSDCDHDTDVTHSKDAFLRRVREMVETHYMLDRNDNFVVPFRHRCEMQKLLLYLGFPRNSAVMLELVINRIAPNTHGLDVFAMQLNQVYNSGLCMVPPTDVSAAPSVEPQQYSMPYELVMELDEPDLEEACRLL
uniref:DUF2428 domain-containing protein n=1 Tax=Anopheles culicifacies TaxID=139723 RepID=A0A182MLN9_9DIPT